MDMDKDNAAWDKLKAMLRDGQVNKMEKYLFFPKVWAIQDFIIIFIIYKDLPLDQNIAILMACQVDKSIQHILI